MEWLRSFWQKVKKPLEILIITVVCLLVIALVVVIVRAYIFKVNVPGLSGKNLWDWLQLLIIPAVLAIGGYVFNFTTSRNEQKATQLRAQTERDIAFDNQREAALQDYIDSISELLLHEKLRESGQIDEVRTLARVRTLNVLSRLDGRRKGIVVQFLHESGLIYEEVKIIDLSQADLTGADLGFAYLHGADLSDAYLHEAHLHEAHLRAANLSRTDLSGADLSYANLNFARLIGADLSGANLTHVANITNEELEKEAFSLAGATMPDGTKHD